MSSNILMDKDQDERSLRDSELFLMLGMDNPEEEQKQPELRVGDLCPKCKIGHLDYDGLLNLACLECGFALGGCFT